MEAKKRFKEVLDFTTSEYGLPVYITDVDLAIDTLLEFMPESLMLEYIKKYNAYSTDMNFDSIRYLHPVILLIAGDDLRKLKNNQNKNIIDKLNAKFLDVGIVHSQLADLLAEINIASLVGTRGSIDLDVDTGVITKNGNKNTDIFHIDSGWYFEVKNFEFGKSEHEKNFAKKANETFSNPANAGKQFQVAKGGLVEEISNHLNGSSISLDKITFQKQHANQIRKANSKFIDGQNAILVLYNIPFKKQAVEAVQNWRNAQDGAKRIKAVIIIGRLKPSENYTRDTHTFFLEDNPKETEEFLETLY